MVRRWAQPILCGKTPLIKLTPRIVSDTFGATPEELKALEAAALAELEGNTQDVDEPTETQAEPQEEAPETDTEDELGEEAETETETTAKSEAEIRKEVERELKKKYYSKLNKEQKRLAEIEAELKAATEGYDPESLDVMRKMAQAETQAREVSKIAKMEEQKFLKTYNPTAQELEAVREIREDYPSMSWEAARNFHLAMTNPEALVKPKSPNLKVAG